MAQRLSIEESSLEESVSETVVSAVAEVTDTDPLSLEPLYTTIDPDALNALLERDQRRFDRSLTRVEFSYCGCDIVVTADGGVRVSKSDQELASDEELA